jgi:5-methylthioribose kinase
VSLTGRQASFRGKGRSLASDPYGYGECHYDVGNIIDLAITTFVNPFTSDSHRKRQNFNSLLQDGPKTVTDEVKSWIHFRRNFSLLLFGKNAKMLPER